MRFPTRNIHILVCLDANSRIGLAHAVRVSGILQLLKTPHHLTVIGTGECLATFFPQGHLIQVSFKDQIAFFSHINEIRPDIILVDYPRLSAAFWIILNQSADKIPIIAIDDEGGDIIADMVINGTVLEQYHYYPVLKPEGKLLLGKEYSLIRPEFGRNHWQNSLMKSVVIVIGSGERAHDWALFLMSGCIELSCWGKITMIVGLAFRDIKKLRNACDNQGVTLESGLPGEKMAFLMSHASVVLITGGMIVYEALAIGVPAIVFPQIKNLVPEARWFSERGCVLDLGYEGGMVCEIVSEAVDRLLSSNLERSLMSHKQRATIDGLGMIRTAQAIDDFLTKAS